MRQRASALSERCSALRAVEIASSASAVFTLNKRLWRSECQAPLRARDRLLSPWRSPMSLAQPKETQLDDALAQLRNADGPVPVTRSGETVAMLISPEAL